MSITGSFETFLAELFFGKRHISTSVHVDEAPHGYAVVDRYSVALPNKHYLKAEPRMLANCACSFCQRSKAISDQRL